MPTATRTHDATHGPLGAHAHRHDDLAVTTLGTCRIADPIIAAARVLPLRREAMGVYGFVHTTKEILQLIDRLEGREIPVELIPMIASAEYGPAQPPSPKAHFFVEVSSLKEIHFGGFLLQINCLDRLFQGRRELLDAVFQLRTEQDLSRRQDRLSNLPSFAEVTELEREVLSKATVHMTTRDELERDLAVIHDRLPGSVTFVCHIDLPDSTGQRRETRAKLCNWMREICAAHGYPLFDPAPRVTEFGRERALAEAGLDVNHYTPEFKLVLGAAFYDTAVTGPEPFVKPEAPVTAVVHELPEQAQPAPKAARSEPQPAAPRVPVPEGAAALRATIADVKARIGRGDIEGAEVLLRAAAIDHPGVVEIHTLLGTVSYHRGDSTSALADLRHALSIDPGAIEPKVMLVKIAQGLNRLDEACALGQELIEAVPNDIKALTVSAKAFTKAKRFQQAAGVWRRLAMLREHQAAPLVEAARCELKGHNYDDAIKVADAALAREPAEIGALVIKAEALQRLKRMRDLTDVVLRIASIDPGAAMATVPALIASSHHEEAARVIAAVREQGHAAAADPVMQAGLVRALTQRARRAAERGETPAAGAAWRAVQLLDPGNTRAASGIRKLVSPLLVELRAASAAQAQEKAIDYCRQVLQIDPNNARVRRSLATLQERTQAWLDAAQSWEKLAELTTDTVTPMLRAARAAGRAERPDEALRLYARLDSATLSEVSSRVASLVRRLIKSMRDQFAEGEIAPAVDKAWLILAVDGGSAPALSLLRKAVAAYRRQLKAAAAEGDVLRQEDVARRIMAIDATRVDALRVLSRIYGNARRWREGIDVQQRLANLQPNEPLHWRKLAKLCRSAGQFDVGVNAALKAVELEPSNTQSLDFLSDILNRQALAA